MSHPLLFQVNTRCWLRAWSGLLGRPVTLATVPESELALWKQRGVTHIWLMGVWTIGPKIREVARAQPDLRALSAQAFGKGGEEKLTGSPFAVEDFTVAKELGGDAALRQFRDRLHGYGLGLVLDFIPNHLGLDHRWLMERNDLFVRSERQRPETFPVVLGETTRWVAHGKDPNWPAWIDTAQLDYRRPATRAAMTEVLQSIATQCDGARCDTAMLPLNDVFDKTWAQFPADAPAPAEEFWAEAISAVKERHPQFMFIAEAYWDLEPRLQALGFDYSYDKKFFEHLTRRDYPALQKHVRAVSGSFHPARFLENHDEERIASLLTAPEQKAAAALLLAQPGLRMLHDGQLAGKTHRTPVQFAEVLAGARQRGNGRVLRSTLGIPGADERGAGRDGILRHGTGALLRDEMEKGRWALSPGGGQSGPATRRVSNPRGGGLRVEAPLFRRPFNGGQQKRGPSY